MSIRRGGLTLVELALTIGLAGIVVIPIGVVLSQHLAGAMWSRDAGVAMNLARSEVERLDSLNDFCHAQLNLTSPTPPPVDGYWPGYPYAMTRVVSCQQNDCSVNCGAAPTNARNGVKRIEIRVTKSGSGQLLASLVTYRTKFVSFGP